MARLLTIGLETGNTSEFTSVGGGFTASTSVVRTGTYAGRSFSALFSPGTARKEFAASNTNAAFFARAYMFFDSVPTNFKGHVMQLTGDVGNGIVIRVFDTGSAKVLQLFNHDDNVQIGSDSPPISLNTWYLVELKADATTPSSTSCEARLGGVAFASGTANLPRGFMNLTVGNNIGGTSPEVQMYVDDIALNDTTGSEQTSYPTDGSPEDLSVTPSDTASVAESKNVAIANQAHIEREQTMTPGVKIYDD